MHGGIGFSMVGGWLFGGGALCLESFDEDMMALVLMERPPRLPLILDDLQLLVGVIL